VDLFTRQAALEGLRLDRTGHLERFKDMPGESGPPPRVVAVDFRGTTRTYFASGVDPAVEARVRQLSFAQTWSGDARLCETLGRTEEDQRRTEHWTYTPSRGHRTGGDDRVQKLDSSDERLRHFSEGFYGIHYPHVFAVVAEDVVVAAATSSREDGRGRARSRTPGRHDG